MTDSSREEILEVMRAAIIAELEKAGVIVANIDPARAALSALEHAGYVVVPKEPTEAMINAGIVYMCDDSDIGDRDTRNDFHTIWSRMLAAFGVK